MSTKSEILIESGTNELEIVEFLLNFPSTNGKMREQYYGINVTKIREIIRMPDITLIPNMPEAVVGVFELRDKIIPALDLTRYLYKHPNTEDDCKMIITEFNRVQTGMIVNDVSRIHRITWSDIVSPDIVQDSNPEQSTITGIIQFPGKRILMLDAEKIVADIDPSSAIDNSGKDEHFDKKIRVFTAEDSAIIRKMIGSRLKSANIEFEPFNDGQKCWERLLEVKESVINGHDMSEYLDLVITDIEMPKLDGYTLTRQIKNDEILGILPVVIFSSMINQDILHKGESVGADAQLSKPMIGELLSSIRRLLGIIENE